VVVTNGHKWGYRPSYLRRQLRRLCKVIVLVLRINGKSLFSNELLQMVRPLYETDLDGKKIIFRTGNGRLLWRAKTFKSEEPLMITWIRSMGISDVVLDIGSNVGVYSIPIAQRVQQVFSCELDPLNVAILKENVVLNSVQEKVVILPFACGGSTRLAEVNFRDLAYGDALQSVAGGDRMPTTDSNMAHKMMSLQVNLDDLFTNLKLARPNKIKIDVDGNEKMVLEGVKNLLANSEEVYFEDSFTDSCADFIYYLKSLGFVESANLEIFSKTQPKVVLGFNRIFKKT